MTYKWRTLNCRGFVYLKYIFIFFVHKYLLFFIFNTDSSSFPSSFLLDWTPHDIPSLSGKTALITGATSGLGFQTALVLALAGAHVFLGGRNSTQGTIAVQHIKNRINQTDQTIKFVHIDHLSFASVKKFTTDIFNGTLDILVNNAGIYGPETRQLNSMDNEDEITLMSNYLSHFVLTGQLLPFLLKSNSPRVVNISSLLALFGKIRFHDINLSEDYSHHNAYSQAKLAILLFTRELQKRSTQNGWGLTVVSAHPGFVKTNMSKTFGERGGQFRKWFLKRVIFPVFLKESVEQGAWPHLFAATSNRVKEGGYYGAGGPFELGDGVREAAMPLVVNDYYSYKMWKLSEKLSNFTWINI